jgi:hypothetical protein
MRITEKNISFNYGCNHQSKFVNIFHVEMKILMKKNDTNQNKWKIFFISFYQYDRIDKRDSRIY